MLRFATLEPEFPCLVLESSAPFSCSPGPPVRACMSVVTGLLDLCESFGSGGAGRAISSNLNFTPRPDLEIPAFDASWSRWAGRCPDDAPRSAVSAYLIRRLALSLTLPIQFAVSVQPVLNAARSKPATTARPRSAAPDPAGACRSRPRHLGLCRPPD